MKQIEIVQHSCVGWDGWPENWPATMGGNWGTMNEFIMGAGKARDPWNHYCQDCDILLLLLNACIICGQ